MLGLRKAVYTVLREAEDRSVSPIPVWEIPIWKDISPKQRKVNAALKLVNETLDGLIAICKVHCFLNYCLEIPYCYGAIQNKNKHH